MKHLQSLNTPVNKLANTLRLAGIYLITVAGVGFVSYRPDTENLYDAYTIFLAIIFILGAVSAFFGETLWKMLLKYTDVTVRRFYNDDDNGE